MSKNPTIHISNTVEGSHEVNLYLGLGTNLLDKKKNIELALELISQEIGKIVKKSSIYKSKAFGFESENEFFNLAILVQTDLDTYEVLKRIESIEKTLGRGQKSVKKAYQDRIIDIDILYYNDIVLDDEKLKIPHPEIKNRVFVLEPMFEIAKKLLDPREKKTIEELLKALSD
ncbi:MAG: 2-amino-4-hydroxy-6-hydroxymethyldihydropteridine diphosphokinase [Bacteroidota bacterium]